jgi:hypothetical protein
MRPWPTQFAVIFVTYIVVDIAYQLSFGLAFMGRLYKQAGIRDVMSQQPNHAWTIVIFVMMIAAVLLKLASNRRSTVSPSVMTPWLGSQPMERPALSFCGQ